MKCVKSSAAKAKFSELLNEVETGETIAITRHGRVIARIVPDEDARKRRIQKAIDGILELQKKNKSATVEEIIAWKNEGRA